MRCSPFPRSRELFRCFVFHRSSVNKRRTEQLENVRISVYHLWLWRPSHLGRRRMARGRVCFVFHLRVIRASALVGNVFFSFGV